MRGRRLDAALLAGTWPDRRIRCAAPAKTHRESSIPRLLTALARSDLVCARAVFMLDFSVANVVESATLVDHMQMHLKRQGAGARRRLRHASMPHAVCVDRRASVGGGTRACGGGGGILGAHVLECCVHGNYIL